MPYSLSQNRCQSLYEDRHGDLWIGTREGLNRFDRKGNRFVRYYFHDCDYVGEYAARSVNVIRTMYEDHAGNFWVGTACGLMRLNRQTGEAIRIRKAPGHGYPVLGYPMRLIHEDQFGTVWAAPILGLGKVDQQNDVFVRFRAVKNPAIDIAIDCNYNDPQCFSEDPNGCLWIGTRMGLHKFDLKTETYIAHYDEKDGLPSSNILKILRDRQGFLWLLTENGISIFNENAPAGRKFYNPDRTVEVENAKTHPGAFIKSRSGEIYWGGTNGVHRFFPENLHNNSFIPQVTLTGFQLFDEPAKLDTAISAVKQIELSHDENFFTFEFTAMDYTNPRKNQYAYKLEGFDDDWVHAGNRSQANYTNVPPGAYTFHVKGSNSDGVWNEQGASIKIIIAPPFWQTWWFRIAAALAVMAFLTALYNYRVSKLLEIERTRLRIARDLHDEIGSSLSSIALSSEFLQGKATLNEKEKGLLNSIDATAHRVIEAMNDIVWAINPGHDKLDQLLFYMKDFAAELLAHKSIAYTFDFPEEELPQSLDMEFRRNLLLIYKELLHNIIKHAQAGRVDIALTKNNGVLVLKVQDDGIGFEPEPAGNGNGLRNMKTRASKLGGRIEFKTRSRAGTAATLTIKIP